jgi:hypothetical protein
MKLFKHKILLIGMSGRTKLERKARARVSRETYETKRTEANRVYKKKENMDK